MKNVYFVQTNIQLHILIDIPIVVDVWHLHELTTIMKTRWNNYIYLLVFKK